MTTTDKRKALQALLEGKKRPAEVLPMSPLFLEVVAIKDQPGRYYKHNGEPINQSEIDALIEKAQRAGVVVLQETSSYLSWDDFKAGREYFNGDDPIII